MEFRDYLTLASTLATGATEAEWRSADSRAYYAAFHVARTLLFGLGFRVPQADKTHGYLWLRLSNARHADVVKAGRRLGNLRPSTYLGKDTHALSARAQRTALEVLAANGG